MMAGASAVQVGTATFLNPSAPLDVIAGIENYLQNERIEDIGEIVGAALPPRDEPATTGGPETPANSLRTEAR
jgi:hypothetical protein